MTRFITITSGKGGVGKTSLSVNLAMQLSRMGKRTCLFDADLGLANINILLGLNPEKTLREVIFGTATMEDIMITQNDRFDILPGSSGVKEMANLDPIRMEALIKSFQNLPSYDFFLFDTSAGIAQEVISFCMAASEVLVVVVPEPTSLTDSYALIKQLKLNNYKGNVKIIVNRCKTDAHAKLVYKKIESVTEKHLNTTVESLGMIYNDEKVTRAISRQKPLLSIYPQSPAAKNIVQIAERLLSETLTPICSDIDKTFWKQCLSFLKSRANYGGGKKDEKKTAGDQPAPPTTQVDDIPDIKKEENKTDSTLRTGIPTVEAAVNDVASPLSCTETVVEKEDRAVIQPACTKPVIETKNVIVSSSLDPLSIHDSFFSSMVEKLNETMLLVADELKNIRQAIEDIAYLPRNPNSQEQPEEKNDDLERIELDLNSFLKHRFSKEGRNFHDNHTQ